MNVSFKGIQAHEALFVLYHNTSTPPSTAHLNKPGFSLIDARKTLESMHSDSAVRAFDYVHGRPIKIKLNLDKKEILDVWLYDRDSKIACEIAIKTAIERKQNKLPFIEENR